MGGPRRAEEAAKTGLEQKEWMVEERVACRMTGGGDIQRLEVQGCWTLNLRTLVSTGSG